MESSSTVAIAGALARWIELTGIGVMVLGGLLAIATFVLRLARRAPRRSARSTYGGDEEGPFDGRYRELRANLGRAILLGLEFLVAADIIGTVAIEPSFRSLGVLALIVAIRTFLSFSLELEISGRWPWQHSPARPQSPGEADSTTPVSPPSGAP
jgi:Protein of unknown function (DUF1622)